MSAPHATDELAARLAEVAELHAELQAAVDAAEPEWPDFAALLPPRAPRVARRYRLADAAVVVGAFAASMLALDSQGLLSWAQRLELGPAQSAWMGALRPWHEAVDGVGLTAPRRALVGAAEGLGRALGGGDDPLLADGWVEVTSLFEFTVVEADAEPEDPPPDPEAVFEAMALEEAAAAAAGKQVTVLLVGDSMIAGSLGTALARHLEKNPRFKVVQAFQTATGLSRPDIYDWMKVIPPLLERESPRFVIASFGANDATTIREGDQTLEFGEAGWRRAYTARVQAMMRTLAGERSQVLWLTLPPMRDARYSQRTADLNRLFAAAARKVPRVELLQLDMLVAGEGGGYATFVRSAEGQLTRFRLDDGVHYSPAGARAVARWGVDWLNERAGGSRR